MAVAKSFQNFEFLSKPFTQNGKQYIIVKNPKTGTERTVRWYTDKEYEKLYPVTIDIRKNLKRCLGFSKGFIYIFKGASYDDEWFDLSNARWNENWGWYIVSDEEVPSNCPKPYTKLYWLEIAENDDSLKDKKTIERICKQKWRS